MFPQNVFIFRATELSQPSDADETGQEAAETTQLPLCTLHNDISATKDRMPFLL
jgi:hypothetical protein